MSTQQTIFGKTRDDRDVTLFTLTNAKGAVVKLSTWGARVVELHMPDRAGKLANIVLGFDKAESYFDPGEPYFGCTIGRVANRIADAKFTLNGKTYLLPAAKDSGHTLHGGTEGWDKRLWTASTAQGHDGPSVTFTLTSPDGDQGFPGTVQAKTIYTLTDNNELKQEFIATTDQPTPVNMTNHSYFNLRGAGNGDILGHELILAADRFTPTDANLIPTGQILSVHGTAMDFTTPFLIGSRIDEACGYDHNFDLRNESGKLVRAAYVREPEFGRVMEVLTTQPGIQVYSGNFLNGSLHGNGGAYKGHSGLCLETQHFPDSVNQKAFLSPIVEPGQTYQHTVIYRFLTR